jgi:tripartite-type tricarboxylate transporter receptor subunit TctC
MSHHSCGLRRLGFDPIGSTPDAFAARIKSELATWARVNREAGIRPM